MKKFLKTKRIILSLIAGLLLTVIALGTGTWSWFTSVANGQSGSFETGYVWLEYDSTDPILVYNVPTNSAGAQLQQDLEALADDAAFAAHIATVGDVSTFAVLANPGLATPGSLVVGGCTFENSSNVPVYFRVEAATAVTSPGGVALDVLQTGTATINPGTAGAIDVTLVPDTTGDYLYCTTSLATGDIIHVGITAYIYGAQNADDGFDRTGTTSTSTNGLQDVEFIFGGNGSGELIQAANNAVNLVAGWSDITW